MTFLNFRIISFMGLLTFKNSAIGIKTERRILRDSSTAAMDLERSPHHHMRKRELHTTGEEDIVDQKFWFDCNGGDVVIPERDTGDSFQAFFYDRYGNLLESQNKTPSFTCSSTTEHNYFDIESSTRVDHVSLRINGDDSLWLDRAWLQINGEVEKAWGDDNTVGLCLSQDPGEAENSGWVEDGYVYQNWTQCLEEICFQSNGAINETCAKEYEYQFWIDCHVDGLSSTGTNDDVTAYFYDADDKIIGTVKKESISCSSPQGSTSFDFQSLVEVNYVRLKIEGGDSLFIDRAWLTANIDDKLVEIRQVEPDDGPEVVYGWDDNDTSGWCLSTESDDVDTLGWTDNSYWEVCEQEICFQPNGVFRGENGACPIETQPTPTDLPTNLPTTPPSQPPTAQPTRLELQEFWIDCYIPSAGSLHTNNNVFVIFYDSNGQIIDQLDSDGEELNIQCDDDSENYFEIESSRQIDSVQMMISGEDALFIDRTFVQVEGVVEQEWNYGNDEEGWCLSTDPLDVEKSGWTEFSIWEECENPICFKPNGDVVGGECYD